MTLLAQQSILQRAWTSTREYGRAAVEGLPTLVMALVVFIGFLIAARIAKSLAQRAAQRAFDDKSLENLAGTIVRIAVLVVGIFCAAGVLFPGLSAGNLVGVLGLSSVAVGFAFKDIFENFLAGVLILAQRPFRIGDQIIVDDFEGTVEDISIRSTYIKTYDGERIIIPNAEVYSSPVQVRTAYDTRRTRFATGIGYGEDIEEGQAIIREALEACEQILSEPAPQVVVTEHADSSVNFEVRFWTESRSGNVVVARDEVATKVKNALDDAGIEIPYPYRTVEFFDMTESAEPDAA